MAIAGRGGNVDDLLGALTLIAGVEIVIDDGTSLLFANNSSC